MAKSMDEILTAIVDRLVEKTDIVDIDPGSIARTFSEVVSEQFYEFYSKLELTSLMSFVSTAESAFLDMIGKIVDCERLVGESDENYRYRITHQVYVVAGANLTSLRVKVLTIPGVKDVIFREFTRGTGSFSVYIITDQAETPQSIINQAEVAITEAKAFGIYAEIKKPKLIPIELKVRLMFNDKASDAERGSIRQTAGQSILSYIDSIPLGGTFVLNELISQIMNANNRIIDIDVYSLKIMGMTRFVRNFSVSWDERVILSEFDVT